MDDTDTTFFIDFKRRYQQGCMFDSQENVSPSDRSVKRLRTTHDDLSPTDANSSLLSVCSAQPTNSLSMSATNLSAKVKVLEAQLQSAQTNLKEAEQKHETERAELQAELRRLQCAIDVGEQRFVALKKLHDDTRLHRDQPSSRQSSSMQQIDTLFAKNRLLETKLVETVQRMQQDLDSLKQQLDERNEKMLQLQLSSDELQSSLSNMSRDRSVLESDTADNKELQNEKDRLTQEVAELKKKLENYDEQSSMWQCMRTELDKYKLLEIENRHLKEENKAMVAPYENMELLREKVRVAEERLQSAAELRAQAAAAQVKFDDASALLDRLCRLVGAAAAPQLLDAVERLVALKRNNDDAVRLQDELAQTKRRLTDVAEQLERAQLQLQLEKQLGQSQTARVKELKLEVAELSAVRGASLELLDRCAGHPALADDYRRRTADIDRARDARLPLLVLADVLLQQLDRFAAHAARSAARNAELEKEAPTAQAAADLAALQKALEESERQRDILETRLDQLQVHGCFDPSTTKVLHLMANPADQAVQRRASELNEVTKERDRLSERVTMLETEGTRLSDLTIRVEQQCATRDELTKQLGELTEKLERANRRYDRVMEAFKKKALEMRQTTLQLTGYQIDIPTDNQYRVSSMFRDSDRDFLFFQQTDSGEMQLLSTEYSDTLGELIATYLTKFNSIPAFLSALSLMLWQQRSTTVLSSS